MKRRLICTVTAVMAVGVISTGCSKELQLVENSTSDSANVSIAEITTTTAAETETQLQTTEEEKIIITIPVASTQEEETYEEETVTEGEETLETDESSVTLEDNQAIISYQAGECIVICIPDGYYEYSSDMTNYVTLMSDQTDDFFTIADYANNIIPSVVESEMGATSVGDNCYISENEKGCDFYYFSESGHAVKITYTTYGSSYAAGYIDGIENKTYLLDMVKGFIFQP